MRTEKSTFPSGKSRFQVTAFTPHLHFPRKVEFRKPNFARQIPSESNSQSCAPEVSMRAAARWQEKIHRPDLNRSGVFISLLNCQRTAKEHIVSKSHDSVHPYKSQETFPGRLDDL